MQKTNSVIGIVADNEDRIRAKTRGYGNGVLRLVRRAGRIR